MWLISYFFQNTFDLAYWKAQCVAFQGLCWHGMKWKKQKKHPLFTCFKFHNKERKLFFFASRKHFHSERFNSAEFTMQVNSWVRSNVKRSTDHMEAAILQLDVATTVRKVNLRCCCTSQYIRKPGLTWPLPSQLPFWSMHILVFHHKGEKRSARSREWQKWRVFFISQLFHEVLRFILLPSAFKPLSGNVS